jgi:hypothetical protein
LAPAIDVVPKEKIVGTRRVLADVEQAKKILILSVDVTTDCDRRLELKEHWLIEVDLADLLAEPNNLDSREASRGSEGGVFDGQKLVENLFQRHGQK